MFWSPLVKRLMLMMLLSHASWQYSPAAEAMTIDELKNYIEIEIESASSYGPVASRFKKHPILQSKSDFELVSLDVDMAGKFSAIVKVEEQEYQIYGAYEEAQYIPVPAHKIAEGRLISASDLLQLKIPISQKKTYYVTEQESLVDRSAKRPLEAGKPIKLSDVKKKILVQQGEVVEIRYQKNNLLLESSGIALNNAGAGDMVRVKKEGTNRVLNGRVLENKVILVE